MSMSIFMPTPRKLQSKFYTTKKRAESTQLGNEKLQINSMRISRKLLIIDCLGRFWLRGQLWQVALHTKCS